MRTARFLVAVALAACSSQAPPPLDGEGASTPLPPVAARDAGAAQGQDAAAPSDAETASVASTAFDAQQCALFVPSGRDVAETRVAAPTPQPTGGAVPPGYYELTAVRIYTGEGGASGATGRTVEETMYLDGIDFEDVLVSAQGISASFAEPVYASGTYRAAGTTLTMAVTCPASATLALRYSSDGRHLLLYDADGVTERELDLR